MTRLIEMIDTRPAEVREYMALVEAEIAKAFHVPLWAQREPSAYARWFRETYKATEIMRRELMHLWEEFPHKLLIPADGVREDGK